MLIIKPFIKKYSFKAKEYFREGGLPYFIKRAFKYIIFLAKRYRIIVPDVPHLIIQKDKVKLCIDWNNFKLFWDGVELTRDIGLHTAFCYNGRQYDSGMAGAADLKIKKLSESELKVTVDWLEVPFVQVWKIRIDNDNLFWNIDMRVTRKISLQQPAVGLMISEYYKEWFNSCEEGVFSCSSGMPREIFLKDADSTAFGVRSSTRDGKYQPGIAFENFGDGRPFIRDKDKVIGIKISKAKNNAGNAAIYLSGRHDYFFGRIKIIKDNFDRDNHIISFKQYDLAEEKENIYIFGDFAELHDRLVSMPGDFDWKVKRIKEAGNDGIKIKIGISRYNFFRLHKIIEFCCSLLGKQANPVFTPLNLFPVGELQNNFSKYLNSLTSISPEQIQFALTDKDLPDLLTAISSQANHDNERELLRILGVISEYAFVGPKVVVIDPFHRCNASCLHCWVHAPKITHAEEFLNRTLDFELYKKIIDDFSRLMVDKIIFQGDGEPLMYNRIFEMIEYARKRSISVSFFTNGSLLDKEKAKQVIDSGVDEIFCSLPAGTGKTFSIVNPKQTEDTFYTIIENMKYLISLKKQFGKGRPILKMTHVIHTLNYHELMQMAKNDVEIDADVARFYLIRLDDSNRFLQLKPQEIDEISNSLGEIKEYLKDKNINLLDTTDFQLQHYEAKTGSWSKMAFLDGGCLIGWYFCLLPAKGDLSLCCHLRTVGDVTKKSFKEIWNSPEYARWRIQAKYLKDNRDVTFLNGVKLYDEHCEHCDTHQVLRDVKDELNRYNLAKFI